MNVKAAPRIVLVGRVSRGERQQDPQSQIIPLRAAADRLGWVVVDVVAEKLSAWDEREAAKVRDKALAPIVAGKADAIAVWALDRVCRGGIADAFAFLARLETHLGAGFYSLQEPFLNTATGDRQQRELMVSLLSWVAHWESQRKSERVKAKHTSKAAHAEAIGQRATWGRGYVPTALDRHAVIAAKKDGGTVRGIAAALRLSKSTVARIIAGGAA